MRPFDSISSPPPLGAEDDILPADTTPTPRWLSPASPPFSSRLATRLHRLATRWTPSRTTLTTPNRLARPALYLLLAALTLYTTHRLLTGRPLLASPLPRPSAGGAPYAVGALDIEVPLPAPQRVSNFTFRDGGAPAFDVETVLFTLYYPTSPTSPTPITTDKDAQYWVPKPIAATARGYARIAGLDNLLVRNAIRFGLWLLVGSIRIPARIGAPLLAGGRRRGDDDDDGGERQKQRLPVVVFSHGMASSRTDYTAYLSSLAAHGVVVAALEHRDGSCPATLIHRGADHHHQAPPEWRYAFGARDVVLPGRRALPAAAEVKEARLAFREAELDAAVQVLRDLGAGSLANNNPRLDKASFAGRLDADRVTLAGHSLGGTGVLRALRRPRPSSFAAGGAVVLDPGKSSGPLNGDVSVPLAICQSASWSTPGPSLFFGRPHFEVVRDIAEGLNGRNNSSQCAGEGGEGGDRCGAAKGWFFTSLGTTHPSVTDAPVLEPLLLSWTTGSAMDAQQGIRQYVHLTRDFITYQHSGAREGLFALSGRDEDGVVSRDYHPKHNDRMPEIWRKYWQVHVAPD